MLQKKRLRPRIPSIYLGLFFAALLLGQLAAQSTAATSADNDLLVRSFGDGFGPGGGGSVWLNLDIQSAKAIAVQADDKIIVVGKKQNDFWLARYDADGILDSDFGEFGQVTTPFLGNDAAHDVAIQPDGKIVAVGESQGRFAIARYHTNGLLDRSFNLSGKALVDFDAGRDAAWAVAIQPDGKILLGGHSQYCHSFTCSDETFALARFNPDGTPDSTFYGEGKRRFYVGNSNLERIRTLTLELDGRIVATGTSLVDRSSQVAVARLWPDGSFDSSLDGNGKMISNFSAGNSKSEAVQSDGKIVFVTWQDLGASQEMKLGRFKADGVLDTTFGDEAMVTIPTSLTTNHISSGHVLRQPDNNLLFAGDTAFNGDLVIASFTPEGQSNPHFGRNQGYTTLDFGEDEGELDLAVDNDGKIILLHWVDTYSNAYLTRLHPNGRLDNGQGRTFSNITPQNDALLDVAIQPDNNKIVVTGYTRTSENKYRLTVARYTPNGYLDQNFGNAGLITEPDFSSIGQAVTIDEQGRILVAGSVRTADSGPNFDFTLRRYNANGDPVGFSAAPEQLWPITDFAGNYDTPHDILVQPDGKILLVGSSRSPNPDFALARYLESGAPDTSFNSTGLVSTDVSGDGSVDNASGAVLQADGKIIVAGSTRVSGGSSDFALIRYLPNGLPDATFADGKVVTDFEGGSDGISTILLQPDGKIIVGGTATVDGRRQFVVARYTQTGKLDNSFNNDRGFALADFGVDALALDMVLEPDGAIVLSGCTQETVDQFAIARFESNGMLDSSFGEGGMAKFEMNSVANACAYGLARFESNGDYILAGSADATLSDSQFALARVWGKGFSNGLPLAQPNSYTTQAGMPLVIDAPGLLENDSDPDEDALTAYLETNPNHGELTLMADGSFSYTPIDDFFGTDSFTYRAFDGEDSSNVATVTIVVIEAEQNTAPIALPNIYTGRANEMMTVATPGVLDNDEDAEGDRLTAVLNSSTNHGTLTLHPDGSFTYQPKSDFSGIDSFTYQADDGFDASEPALVTIIVTPMPPATSYQLYLPIVRK